MGMRQKPPGFRNWEKVGTAGSAGRSKCSRNSAPGSTGGSAGRRRRGNCFGLGRGNGIGNRVGNEDSGSRCRRRRQAFGRLPAHLSHCENEVEDRGIGGCDALPQFDDLLIFAGGLGAYGGEPLLDGIVHRVHCLCAEGLFERGGARLDLHGHLLGYNPSHLLGELAVEGDDLAFQCGEILLHAGAEGAVLLLEGFGLHQDPGFHAGQAPLHLGDVLVEAGVERVGDGLDDALVEPGRGAFDAPHALFDLFQAVQDHPCIGGGRRQGALALRVLGELHAHAEGQAIAEGHGQALPDGRIAIIPHKHNLQEMFQGEKEIRGRAARWYNARMTFAVNWSAEWHDIGRLLLAYALALPVGWHRELEAQSIGVRTFPLVAMASCGYVLLSTSAYQSNIDAQSRVIQGLVAGIGFIGGGAILKAEGNVHGTATAASIWNTGVVGAAVAQDRYVMAATLAGLNLFALRVLLPLKLKLDQRAADRRNNRPV